MEPDHSIFIGDGGSNELQGAADVGMIAYQAIWFLPEWMRNEAFPGLNRPSKIMELLE
ncbi:hypothetical protein J6TS2_22780 [Heyndrickxia sporothermodurans]|nr:hypothetical protein J6TS2_22780 [Heyndrickxia sporothermodurans]